MEIFGIGPLEFLLIMLLALIILGPKDMEKVGRSLGRTLNKLVKSDTWRTVRQASERMKTLPNELMREAEIEDIQKNFKDSLDEARRIAPPNRPIPTEPPADAQASDAEKEPPQPPTSEEKPPQ